uniref:Uncharacterized protein n=1 Tax=Panagrolaimus davidi TaxID=227884 RepID=A0A914P4H3_9BILA
MTTFSHFTDKHLIVGGSNDQYTNINLNQNQKFGNDSFSKHKKTDLLNEKSKASALGVGKVVKRREMEKKNPFEFPRQQESNPGPSEISQFRSSQQLQNPNANNRNSMPQYSVQQQQHLPPIATFQYNQGHGVYPNPSFQDPLSDVLRRLAEMDARMSAYDQKIEELEQQNRVQSTRISELNALLTHFRPQDITFVFDPQNIRDRASFDFDAKFNNGNDERINLWDTASTLSAWRRSANDSLPGEIFRGVVKQIYNEELSYYTASKGQRQGLTSLYSLKEKIKDLVIAGYVNAETSDTEKAVIEAWVNENMEKVSKHLFNNSRRKQSASPGRKRKPPATIESSDED